MKPLISIIIPTFNRANLLKRALSSVTNQTYQNIEIIIIDNYSSDNTNDVVNSFHDKRIIFKKLSNNGNIARSRNYGIKLANGEWVAFLDSDDWWKKNKLDYCLSIAKHNIDFIYHKLQIVKKNKKNFFFKKTLSTRLIKKPIRKNLLIKGNVINNSSVMVKKYLLDKVNGINENKNIITAEDYNTWLKISCLTDNFLFINKTLGYYYAHELAFERDMYLPTKYATEEFVKYLSDNDRTKFNGNLEYLNLKYIVKKSNFKHSISELRKKYNKIFIIQKIKIFILIFFKLIP